MKKLLATAILAGGMAGCVGIPPPPDPAVTGNIYAWLVYLCQWKAPLDMVIDALDEAGRLDDTQDIATAVCSLKPPEVN